MNERLKGLLGDESQLTFRNLQEGSSVSFTIPIEEYAKAVRKEREVH
ncbi:hypothetical protein [Piscibacillus salipiscarius]|nr:hypothetical protein [Piscibacillus salipiscarius]